MGRSVSVGRGGAPVASGSSLGSRTVLARRPRSLAERRRALRESIVASGVAPAPSLATLDMARLSAAERYFYAEALGSGIANFGGQEWPTEAASLDATGAVFRDGAQAVFRSEDGGLALVTLQGGWFRVSAATPDPASVASTVAAFRAAYPASYLVEGEGRVPITFWTCGNFGATSRLRRVEASSWSKIERNYPDAVRSELSDLMAWTEPSRDGQLILWQGPPGTGKTWCLRALASEWSSWAEFHYITDPDVFFVEKPSYMIDVLLSDSYDVIHEESGDVVAEAGDKWRVLILEDTGELLAADAKERYGQGLSRLLNVVDGMIGQGLRVLALITTNDELGDLAPAAVRPGRCASRTLDGKVGPTVFGPLSASEASVWLGETVEEGGTLAELYARSSDAVDAFSEDEPESPVEAETISDDEERRRDFDELLSLANEPLVAASVPEPEPSSSDRLLEAVVDGAKTGERVALAAMEALGRFAGRETPAPQIPAYTTHMHLPDHALTVHHHDGDVNVEPYVAVEPAKVEPVIDVRVEAAEPPVVNVAAAETPEVHFHAPEQKPRAVRVEYDSDGFRHFVTEDPPSGETVPSDPSA